MLFEMFVLSNHIPKIDPKETAVYNRYKQISFNSHFDRTGERKEEDPESLKFIADTKLSSLIKSQYYFRIGNFIY
jgi:phage/plasmid-associated DNA primase